jgi:hypothetical protein
VDQAQIYGLIQPDEASYLVSGGAEKIYYRWAGTSALSYGVYAVQTKDAPAANALTNKAFERGKQVGVAPTTVPELPQGVIVGEVFGPNSAIAEATYTSGRMSVRVRIVQTGPNNDRELQRAIQQSVAVIVKALPVG